MLALHTTTERSGPGGPAIARPTPEQLVELWNLRTMPTENVRFSQSYVDDEIGPDGKPLCSAIVALLVDDPSVGAQDIWVATRGTLTDPWSAPVNLGSAVNTTAAETRPSLSKDGKQLLFGRSPGPEGSSDIYVTTR